MNRRGFLQISLTAAGGLLFQVPLSAIAQSKKGGELAGGYIEITPENQIIIGAPNPEIGQGIRTALPMLIAEELGVPYRLVTVRQLPLTYLEGDEGPRPKFPGQGAGGSWSVVSQWEPMRKAGAVARDVLTRAAAKRWGVSPDAIRFEGTSVVAPSGAKATFADLAPEAAMLDAAEDVALKSADRFTVIGTEAKDVDAKRIVTGAMDYAIDQSVAGAVSVTVIHSPRFESTAIKVDDSAARSIPGYVTSHIIEVPEDLPKLLLPWRGVAVVAEKHWQALEAAKKIQVEWSEGPYADETSESLLSQARTLLDSNPTHPIRADGDVPAAFADADSTHEADYELPYVSHAPMEPQNCVADVREDGCTIIAPVQFPTSANYYLRDLLGLTAEQIDIHIPRMGGGFGRRLTVDHVVEGALISKQLGRPVKVIWSRTDDLRNDFYRPGGIHRLRASIKNNAVSGWQYHVASPSKYYGRSTVEPQDLWKAEIFPDDFPAALIPNLSLDWYEVKSGAFRGSWRAPASVANAFAVECFVDELAQKMGKDPLELRLEILADTEELAYDGHGGPTWSPLRLAGVLRAAAEAAQWNQRSGNRPMGIAAHFTFGSYVAQVIELERHEDRWRVGACTGAIDCGLVVNPLGVRKQMEGGLVDGISTAMGLEVRVENGGVVNTNFNDYPLLRISAAPRDTNVVIIDSEHDPRGVGEPPIVPVAPALANAVFAATGTRMRRQPFLKHYPQAFGRA